MPEATAYAYPRFLFLERETPVYLKHAGDEHHTTHRRGAQYAILLALFLDQARVRLGDPALPAAPSFYQTPPVPYGDAVRKLRERGAVLNGQMRKGPAELISSSDLPDALVGSDDLALARAHTAISRIAEEHRSETIGDDDARDLAEHLENLFAGWCGTIESRVGSRLDRTLRRSRASPPEPRRPWVEWRCELWLRRLDAPRLFVVTGPAGSGRRDTLQYLRTWQNVEFVRSADDLDKCETDARARPDGQAVAAIDAVDQPELVDEVLCGREGRWHEFRCAIAGRNFDDVTGAEVLDLGSAKAREELAELAAERYIGPDIPDRVRSAHARFIVDRCGARLDALEEITQGGDRCREVLSTVQGEGSEAGALQVLAARDDGSLSVDELLGAVGAPAEILDTVPSTLRRGELVELDPLARFMIARARPLEARFGHAAVARFFLRRLASHRIAEVTSGALRDGARHLAKALQPSLTDEGAPAALTSLDLPALLRGDWLSAKWKLSPEELAKDLSDLAAALPPGMRAAPAGAGPEALPASLAEVARLVGAATALQPPPNDLWTALHDSAINQDARSELLAALRTRAISSGGPLVCLLAERDVQHPVAQLWVHEDRRRAAPRELVPLGARAAVLIYAKDSPAELLNLRTNARGPLELPAPASCAADTGDGRGVVGMHNGALAWVDETGRVLDLFPAERLHGHALGITDVVAITAEQCVVLVQTSSGEFVMRVDLAEHSVEPTHQAPLPAKSVDRLRRWPSPNSETTVLLVGPQRVANPSGRDLLSAEHLGREKVVDVTAYGDIVAALDSAGRLHRLELDETPVIVGSIEDGGYHAALALPDGTVVAGDDVRRIWRFTLDTNDADPAAPRLSEPALESRTQVIKPFRTAEVVAVDASRAVALVGLQDNGLHIIRRDRLSHEPRLVRPAVEASNALLLTSGARHLDIRAWDVDRFEERRREKLTRHEDLALVPTHGEGDPALVVMFSPHVELLVGPRRRFVGSWEPTAGTVLTDIVALGEGRVAVLRNDGVVVCLRASADGLSSEREVWPAGGRAVALAGNGSGAGIIAVLIDEERQRHSIRLLEEDKEIAPVIGARPLLAVSPRALRAWAVNSRVFISDGIGRPVPIDTPAQVTALAWCGERAVAATADGILHLMVPERDGWHARAFTSRADDIVELIGIGGLAVLVRLATNRLELIPLDDPAAAVELPEGDVHAVAAAPVSDYADPRWLIVGGRHPEQLTWREVRSKV